MAMLVHQPVVRFFLLFHLLFYLLHGLLVSSILLSLQPMVFQIVSHASGAPYQVGILASEAPNVINIALVFSIELVEFILVLYFLPYAVVVGEDDVAGDGIALVRVLGLAGRLGGLLVVLSEPQAAERVLRCFIDLILNWIQKTRRHDLLSGAQGLHLAATARPTFLPTRSVQAHLGILLVELADAPPPALMRRRLKRMHGKQASICILIATATSRKDGSPGAARTNRTQFGATS